MRADNTRNIQIMMGDGKGKTTAAVGQAMRTAGNGYSVVFLQFIKSGSGSGEIELLKNITGIEYKSFGRGKFLTEASITQDDRDCVNSGMAFAVSVADNKSADLLVLDEIGAVLELGLLSWEYLFDLFDRGKGWLDMVLTGRTFPDSVIDAADCVTSMQAVKHPYDKGVPARRGIEF